MGSATKIPQQVASPVLVADKEGCLKVRLAYLTHKPKHVRNLLLKSAYCIKPPYNEDVCVLMPAAKCFDDFESYLNAFEFLQRANVVDSGDVLVETRVLVEDELTLAYVIN